MELSPNTLLAILPLTRLESENTVLYTKSLKKSILYANPKTQTRKICPNAHRSCHEQGKISRAGT